MRTSTLYFIASTCFLLLACTPKEEMNINQHWRAELSIGDGKQIPFEFIVENEQITLLNAEEKLSGGKVEIKGKQVHIELPVFDSYFDLEYQNNTLKGFWVVRNKIDYKVELEAKPYEGYRIKPSNEEETKPFDGLWAVSYPPSHQAVAVGKFKQDAEKVTGTILTSTGDYRFLEGSVLGDSMVLSSFTGAHAFMICAKQVGDSVNGTFYSSKHYKADFKAVRTDSSHLANPFTLTYLKKDIDSLIISHPTLDGDTITENFSQYTDQVVLIQLLGSWCANCYDEAQFFKSLHKDYSSKGLKIIGLSYECSKDLDQAKRSMERFKAHNKLPYELHYGGYSSKKSTSEQWHMMNQISSYPTSILINKKGEIVQIHTGFNGPGTGQLYLDYTKEMRNQIEHLLAE